jgi:hypothetical protein
MKQLWNSFKVTGIKEAGDKTILQIETSLTKEEILRYKTEKGLCGEIRFDDGRSITAEQRKKVFAILKDISLYTGYEAEYLRDLLTLAFCLEINIGHFSLSDCSLEVAREFISWLLEFCIEQEIPLSKQAIEYTDDISAYLYSCIKRHACCVCGSPATVYKIGREELKISLCSKHFDEVSLRGMKKFNEIYKVYALKINEK